MPQTKAQKSVVRRWIKNLESGQYKQGKDHLVILGNKEDKFCCLGVLCDMATRAGVIALPKETNSMDFDKEISVYRYGKTTTSLPPKVQKWAGLADNSGEYDAGNLAEHNDDGYSFKEIAKIIRSKPKGLFI